MSDVDLPGSVCLKRRDDAHDGRARDRAVNTAAIRAVAPAQGQRASSEG